MKKILRRFNRWRYKRLYRKLFWHYAKKFNYTCEAAAQADEAFLWLTGEDWKDWN